MVPQQTEPLLEAFDDPVRYIIARVSERRERHGGHSATDCVCRPRSIRRRRSDAAQKFADSTCSATASRPRLGKKGKRRSWSRSGPHPARQISKMNIERQNRIFGGRRPVLRPAHSVDGHRAGISTITSRSWLGAGQRGYARRCHGCAYVQPGIEHLRCPTKKTSARRD